MEAHDLKYRPRGTDWIVVSNILRERRLHELRKVVYRTGVRGIVIFSSPSFVRSDVSCFHALRVARELCIVGALICPFASKRMI